MVCAGWYALRRDHALTSSAVRSTLLSSSAPDWMEPILPSPGTPTMVSPEATADPDVAAQACRPCGFEGRQFHLASRLALPVG